MNVGTWSFEWTVPEDGEGYDSFSLMLKNEDNFSDLEGLKEGEIAMTGYTVGISTKTKEDAGLVSPGLTLFKWMNASSPHTIRLDIENGFPTTIVGPHHIDITRDDLGDINVIFDNYLVLNRTDTSYDVGENFMWASFWGDTSIDNLKIYDTVETISIIDTNTDPTSAGDEGDFPYLVLMGVLILPILLIKKK